LIDFGVWSIPIDRWLLWVCVAAHECLVELVRAGGRSLADTDDDPDWDTMGYPHLH
jgi:hypothetical protein